MLLEIDSSELQQTPQTINCTHAALIQARKDAQDTRLVALFTMPCPMMDLYYIFQNPRKAFRCIIKQIVILVLAWHNFSSLSSSDCVPQSMRNQNSRTSHYPQNKITIVAVTWNLFASVPPINSLVALSRSSSFSSAPDIIFIGTQQCERGLFFTFCCEAKDRWENMLTEVFSQYFLSASLVMRGLHSAVMVKSRLRSYFSQQSSSCLKAGTCGLMGNKGAISLEITLFGQPFQFINCHLAPHQTANEKRNQTVSRILEDLLNKDQRFEVIFLGDFNYRIEMTKDQYQTLISQRVRNTDDEKKYSSMLHKQQMHNQLELKSDFLLRFYEGRISFPPTYKMGVESNEYNRERIPGWTDRIFARKKQGMQLQGYLCEYNTFGSDHRPVIAKYVKPISQADNYSQHRHNNEARCQLI